MTSNFGISDDVTMEEATGPNVVRVNNKKNNTTIHSINNNNNNEKLSWKWSHSLSNYCAPQIFVTGDGLVARRTTGAGQNPSVRATTPLTRNNSYFRVHVTRLGNWIGIGVCDSNFVFFGSKTLGTQITGINSGYFWQNSGIRKIQMHGQPSTDVREISLGDKIDVKADFDTNRIYYFNNDILQGWLTVPVLAEGTLYPCINISSGTEVRFLNDERPLLNVDMKPIAHHWKWSTTRKAPSISSKDGLTVVRAEHPKGMNPAVVCTEPMTKSRSHFRVQVKSPGKWLGIGIADERFILNDSKTLGTQRNGINIGYFYQSSGINRLQMYGETSKDDVKPLQPNDIVDIKLDFEANRIYFFCNDILQGYIAPTQNTLREGRLFPAVNLSVGAELTLRNVDNPELDITQKIQQLAMREDVQDNWTRPHKQFPTRWKWGSSPNRKSPAIELSQNDLAAKRETGGNNPGVMCSDPITRNSNYFVVEILRLGNWIGIGIADCDFLLNGSKTLGQQTTGINSSYFYQANVRKLQMYGEKSISDVAPIGIGDIISFKVDFDNNCIYYFNNDILQGCLQCTKNTLQEGKIFPCVDFSTQTEVIIRNVDHMPYAVQEAAQ